MTSSPIRLSKADRDKLISEHTSYAQTLAARVRRDLSTDLDIEELNALALQGLVEAAERFDPSRGAAFTTFSYYRIRGAIYDGLRKAGWLGRNEYGRFQAASNNLLQPTNDQPQAAPSSTESALENLADAVEQITTVFVTSLDAMREDPADDKESSDASKTVEIRQLSTQMHEAMRSLPEREQKLIKMHYFQELPLAEAGQLLGMSRSWASRVHARAIANLTQLLQ